MNGKVWIVSLLWAVTGFGQSSARPSNDLGDRAVQEFHNNDWPAAERDFRELVKRDPSNIFANMYLGQTLFRQEHYAEAVMFFQKTRDLQRSGKQLNTTQGQVSGTRGGEKVTGKGDREKGEKVTGEKG